MQEIILNVKKNPGTQHLGCLRQHEKSKYEEEEQRMKRQRSKAKKTSVPKEGGIYLSEYQRHTEHKKY